MKGRILCLLPVTYPAVAALCLLCVALGTEGIEVFQHEENGISNISASAAARSVHLRPGA